MAGAQFRIDQVFSMMGNVVVAGTVLSGAVERGMTGIVNAKSVTILKIEKAHQEVPAANAGEVVGMKLSGNKDDLRVGTVINF